MSIRRTPQTARRPAALARSDRLQPRTALAAFTAIEVVVACAVLLIGVLALTSTAVAVHTLRETDRDRRAATASLRAVTENVKAFAEASRESGGGWPASIVQSFAPGASPGASFDVPGLEPWPGETNVGSITIVTDETLTDSELGVELAMPRDLDNDGAIGDTDVSESARLLPVVLRARWNGAGGPREMARAFYLLGF